MYEAHNKWISELNPPITACIPLVSPYQQIARLLDDPRRVKGHNTWCLNTILHSRMNGMSRSVLNGIRESVSVTRRIQAPHVDFRRDASALDISAGLSIAASRR